MTHKIAKEFLHLFTALAEGKTIQSHSVIKGWVDVLNPVFSQDVDQYRIKPEAITIEKWAVVYPSGVLYNMTDTEEEALRSAEENTRPLKIVKLTGTFIND